MTHRFLAAFTNRDGTIPTLPALPHYFMLDAVVRVADSLGTVTTTDLHGFIAPRAELLARGRLVDFEEHEIESRTEIAARSRIAGCATSSAARWTAWRSRAAARSRFSSCGRRATGRSRRWRGRTTSPPSIVARATAQFHFSPAVRG